MGGMRPSLDDVEAAVGVGSYAFELSDGRLSWSPNLYHLLDAPPGPPSIEGFFDALDPVDAQRARDDMGAAVVSGDAPPQRYRTRTGRVLLARVHVERDALGAPVRHVGTLVDVTETAALEERLHAKRALLEHAQAIARVGSWRWNTQTGVITWSKELYRITGVSEDRAPTVSSFDERVHPDDLARLQEVRARSVATGEPASIELRILRPDGVQRWVRMNAESTRNASGHTVFVGVVHDITEEHDLHHRIAQQDRLEAVARLASGIAHDFNNLLTVISTNLQLLADEGPSEELGDAIDAAKRAAALTMRLQSLQMDREEPSLVTDLRALVLDCGPTLQQELGERALHLELPSTASAKVPVRGVQRALTQLVRNAREAQARHVTVQLTEAGAEVALVVRDDGEGMSPETLARCGEPFFSTRGPRASGGLGLSLVRELVQRSGGSFTLSSTPGQGTVARLAWPVDATPAFAPDRVSVLVIEDDDAVRRVIRRLLERSGRRVIEASDPEEARAHLHPRLGLVLSDVVMPRGGGRRVLELHARHCPEVPLVFMSGYTGDAPWLSGQDFLAKPFTLEALERLVRAQL
jgi:PAS domain S-box-containing protein